MKKNHWFACKKEADIFLKKAGILPDGKLPIDIEVVALQNGYPTNVLTDLRQFGIKGTAYKKIDDGTFEILIDDYHYSNDELSVPFTIAEELSHILIHSHIFEDIDSPEKRIEYERGLDEDDHQVLEMEAKRVASCLLLPVDLFLPYVKDYVTKHETEIRAENPNSDEDLTTILGRRLSPRLGLSQIIVKKALVRYLPNTVTSEIENQFKLIIS